MKTIGLTALISVSVSGLSRAEFYNCFVVVPVFHATTFEFVIEGDVTAFLDLASMATDPLVNPFAYVDANILGVPVTSTAMASVNIDGNTEVVFTGSNPVAPSYTFDYGPGSNGEPHIGLNGFAGGGTRITTLSQSWSDGSSTDFLPALSVLVPPPGSVDLDFLIFYADVTSGGVTTGGWFELPYEAGSIPTATFLNGTGDAFTLSNVGFFTSPDLIPLPDLNFGSTPPPGFPGSSFTSLPTLEGRTLAAGQELTIAVPEPASWLALGLGLAGLALGQLHRSKLRS